MRCQSAHLMAVIEQQLPRLLPRQDADTAACLEALGELSVNFRDSRSRSLLAHILAGTPANHLEGLVRLVEEHPHEHVRSLYIEALPAVAHDASGAQCAALVPRLLQHGSTVKSDRERSALHLALAQIAQHPDLPQATHWNEQIDAACRAGKSQSVLAWGHLVAGPHLSLSRRIALIEDLLALIGHEVPDKAQQTIHDPHTDEITFVLDSTLGSHTEAIPLTLQSLVRIGISNHLPDAPRRRITATLCEQWKRVSNWEVIWGPANVQELGRSLGRLASHVRYPDSLRMMVAEALLPNLTHLPLAQELAQILHTCHGSGLAELAARATTRLIKACSNHVFADDEQEDLSRTLALFILIPELGEEAEKLRRQLAGLLSSMRHHCKARTRQTLLEQWDQFSVDIQQRLDWLR